MGFLKGVSPCISPDLLQALAKMGHGDEVVLADAYFPAHTVGANGPTVLRADGICIPILLDSILRLINLDSYVYSPVTVMEIAEVDKQKGLEIPIWDTYKTILSHHKQESAASALSYLERFKFYERAKKAAVIVQTGETAVYGNIILVNGLVTPQPMDTFWETKKN